MGNKLTSNGTGGFGDSPYSKTIGKHIARYWSEVFILAQDGAPSTSHFEDSCKWQQVVDKLVPVNVARIQDRPAVCSHVTAYNTKVEKILDAFTYHPGINFYRPSEFFVHWTDPTRGLTWGLNFISAEDAESFINMTCGRPKGKGSIRRVNSTSSLSTKGRCDYVQGSASNPATPDKRRSPGKLSVKFADLQKNACVPSKAHGNNLSLSLPVLPQQNNALFASDENKSTSDFERQEETGKRLSDWRIIVAADGSETLVPIEASSALLQQCKSPSQRKCKDALPRTRCSSIACYLENEATESSSNFMMGTTACEEKRTGVWQKMLNDEEASLDQLNSGTFKRMLCPLLPQQEERTQGSSDYEEPLFRATLNAQIRAVVQPSGETQHNVDTNITGIQHQSPQLVTCSYEPQQTAAVISEMPKILPQQVSERQTRISLTQVWNIDERNNSEDLTSTTPKVSLSFVNSSQEHFIKIRKAGRLLMKRWLALKEGGLIVLRHEYWQDYWCCLRGTQLHLQIEDGPPEPPTIFSCDITIDITNCLTQAVPEYPRRQHVFCLTSSFGAAYLLQARNEDEVESWMRAIHISAAMTSARTSSQSVAAMELRKDITNLEQRTEKISKLLSSSETNSSCSRDRGGNERNNISNCQSLESEFELLQVKQFMAKCYLASLEAKEMPSSKKLLSSATSTTKCYLNYVGVFTASSIHAYTFMRSLFGVAEPLNEQQTQSKKAAALDVDGQRAKSSIPTSKITTSLQVILPNLQASSIIVSEKDTVLRVYLRICESHLLDPEQFFVVLRKASASATAVVPKGSQVLQEMVDKQHCIEIREKLYYHLDLAKASGQKSVFGLTIRARKHSAGWLSLYVGSVDEKGAAKKQGIQAGDELFAVNGKIVRCHTPQAVEKLFKNISSLCLVLRTRRLSLPTWLEPVYYSGLEERLHLSCSNSIILPSQVGALDLNEDGEKWFSDSSGLFLGKAKYGTLRRNSLPSSRCEKRQANLRPMSVDLQARTTAYSTCGRHTHVPSATSSDSPQSLALGSSFCKSIEEAPVTVGHQGTPTTATPTTRLSSRERLEKLIFEMLETERSYGHDLSEMIKQYLEPLSCQNLQQEEFKRFLNCAQQLRKFQARFLDELRDAAGTEFVDSKAYPGSSHLRNGLLHLGGVFALNAGKFKGYSTFTSLHYRILKFLKGDDSAATALMIMTASLNSTNEQSSAFESYLIKPTQRVVRYPLFLQQIKSLLKPNTPEFLQIAEALTKMERIASYINESQRIYEEYGEHFHELESQHPTAGGQLINLNLSDLHMHGEVQWLNFGGSDSVAAQNAARSSAAYPSLLCQCFVFRTAIVLVGTDSKWQRCRRNKCTNDTCVRRLIPLTEVEINASDQCSKDNHFVWILVHIDPKSRTEFVYHLANSHNELKQQFLRSIKKAGQSVQLESLFPFDLNSGSNSLQDDKQPNNEDYVNHSKTNSVNSEEPVSLSSPDSGFPVQHACFSRLSATTTTTTNDVRVSRPVSFHSSQSDAGYGSNNEVTFGSFAKENSLRM